MTVCYDALFQRCREYAVATRLFLVDVYKGDNLLKIIISVSTWKETISEESLRPREGPVGDILA